MSELSKTAPRPKTAPEGELDLGVERSPVRCPYCHDRCGPEDEAAIVCQQCLSRHHGACWREGGQCASCSSTRALRGAPPPIEVAPAELELLKRDLPREALERLQRRLDVSEGQAQQALLEAACRELDRSRRLPPGAIVAIVAIVMAFSIPILAIIFSH